MISSSVRGFLFFLFSVFALLPAGFAASPQESFQQANQSYSSRNFPEAIKAYEDLERQGLQSGDLFYNLANSYYRQGEMGEAVYYYLKALRYSPRDRDLVANYKYVLSKRAEGYERSVSERAQDMLFFLKDLLTLREMICLALICYWFLFAAGLLYYLKRKAQWRIVFLVFLILNLYILPAALLQFYEQHWQKLAVTVIPQLNVYSEPNDAAIRLFELREGAITQVKDEKEGFLKIQYRNGQSGWVKASEVKVLS